MLLANEVTVGRLPSVLFAIMVLLVAAVCGVFLVVVRRPPTVYVREAIGTVMIDPAAYDPTYHEAIGRRFLNMYGNYNYHNYLAKNWWAGQLTAPALRQYIMEVARRNEETVTTFAMTRSLVVLSHHVEWDDPRAGRSVHAFRVRMTDFYGVAEHDRIEAWYLMDVLSTNGAHDVSDLGAHIVALSFYLATEADAPQDTAAEETVPIARIVGVAHEKGTLCITSW